MAGPDDRRAARLSSGGEAFALLLETTMLAGCFSSDGVAWLRVGQLVRDELRWDDYPTVPPNLMN